MMKPDNQQGDIEKIEEEKGKRLTLEAITTGFLSSDLRVREGREEKKRKRKRRSKLS